MTPLVSTCEGQLVVVGDLADAGVFDFIGHLAHRREHGVDRDQADRRFFRAVERGRAVALAGIDRHFHVQLRALVERAEDEIRVHDFDIGARLDHAGGDFHRAFGVQAHFLRPLDMHAHGDRLDVQDDVGDVLAHAFDGGEFMQHAVDLLRPSRPRPAATTA